MITEPSTSPIAPLPARYAGLLLLLAVIFGISWIQFTRLPVDAASADQSIAAPSTGFLASDFTLVGLDGKDYQLSAFRGKPVILNIWATWCPPCRAEMPAFERVWQRYNQGDVMILAVNQRENAATIERFEQQVVDVSFPILLDSQGEVSRLFAVTGLPTTFFIDAEGRIQSVSMGGMDEATLLASIQKIINPSQDNKLLGTFGNGTSRATKMNQLEG